MVLIGSVSAGMLVVSQPFVGDMLAAALTDTSANALMGSDSLPYLRNLSFPNRN